MSFVVEITYTDGSTARSSPFATKKGAEKFAQLSLNRDTIVGAEIMEQSAEESMTCCGGVTVEPGKRCPMCGDKNE